MVKLKRRHFLFRLPNRKCQPFPAYYWLIHAVFLLRGFSGCRTLWCNRKCCHFLFYSPNRKCQHFPACNWLLWAVSQFNPSPLCSSSLKTPFLRKRHKSINYGQENAGTSCVASKTGSDDILDFNIVFPIPGNPLHEKTTRINQLRTGKYWHVLFGKQNRKWRHFQLHHCVRNPEIPLSQENGIDQAINGRKMLTLPVFGPFLTLGGSALSPFALKMDTQFHRHNFLHGV